jgi:hypothetical protein
MATVLPMQALNVISACIKKHTKQIIVCEEVGITGLCDF